MAARIVVDLRTGLPALQTIADLPDGTVQVRLQKPQTLGGGLQNNAQFPTLDAHRAEARHRISTGIAVTANDLWCDTIFFLAFDLPSE